MILDGGYPVRLAAWCLLQFTWQGVVVLALAIGARRALRHHSASVRYRTALGALALLTAIPLATALSAHHAATAAAIAAAERGAGRAPGTPPARWPAAVIVVWAAGALIGVARLAGGWRRMACVVDSGVARPAARTLVAQLSSAARIARLPCVAESAAITTPLVTGWWRPVLLLPAGMLEALPADELRAVILHELAHVRRRDFAVNLLQRAIEIVLWPHPAVWLISREIRTEREHCCDDEAVCAGGRAPALARALITLEERRRAPSLALAGSGGALTRRVHHIMLDSPGVSSGRGAAVAMSLGVAVAVCALPLAGAGAPADALGLVVPVVTVDAVDPAGPFSVQLVAGRVQRASLAGVPLPAERIFQRGSELTLRDDRGNAALTLRIEPDGSGVRWEPRQARAR